MWYCAQIGAREHYAVARALHKNGRLAALYTDFWAGPATRRILEQTRKLKLESRNGAARALRSLAARYHPDLANAPVKSWNARSLAGEVRQRRRNNADTYGQFIETGAAFATRIRETLKRRTDLNPESIFFSYDTGALEAMEWCRDRGVKCILNQMDPNRVEVALVRAEEKLWPDWTTQSGEVSEAYFSRREQEWSLADIVMVNSDFCREALIQQGVPRAKLAVVPLCFEAGGGEARPVEDDRQKMKVHRRQSGGELRILFLGQVILRKGVQYLMQAAKLLEQEPVRFDSVGPVGISDSAVALAPKNMVFHGRTSRDQVADWYRQSDVFVLPTLSDGFALTQLEAMSHGLPVVATPNCGAVVSDGVDGFIVPARNAGALAKTFLQYLNEPELIRDQSAAALAKVRQFTVEHLAANLRSLEETLR